MSNIAWASDVDKCLALTAKNHHKQAFPICLPLAEQGNAEAQSSVGEMYEHGWGVNKNHTLAEQWYRKAAKQGLVSAQVRLGGLYYKPESGKPDYDQAMKWFSKAEEQGSLEAKIPLAWMYHLGYGVKKDNKRAGQLYYQAGLMFLKEENDIGADFMLQAIKHLPEEAALYAAKLEEKM